MREFLVWYSNRDVIPFLQAIDKQFAFYQQHNIDMFKDGISLPGLTLLYLFKDLPSKTYFTVFNKTNNDLHQLVKTTSSVVLRDYAEEHDIMSAPRRMLVGSYRGDKILLSTPLLQWYLMH